jgi:hypothetical protein
MDWIEWEGSLMEEGWTFAQREYLPSEGGNLTMARAGVEKFMERAFRRPAQAEEVDSVLKLVGSEMASGEKFESAMRTGFLSVLCAKDFLYLVEGNAEKAETRLTDWELASRLSYFLWSTMPDQDLRDAARAGTLRQPEVLRAHARRMLQHPNARRFARAFPRDWLQLREGGSFRRTKSSTPDYDAYLEKSMVIGNGGVLPRGAGEELGSSGFRVTFKPALLLEGFRPKGFVRLWPAAWKVDDLPREECLYY